MGGGGEPLVRLGDGFLLDPRHLTLVQQGKDQTHGLTRRQDQRVLVLVLLDLVVLALVIGGVVPRFPFRE
jgi:hypothetical protein